MPIFMSRPTISPALMPMRLASSPTVMASPTRMRRLMALGVVISVLWLRLTGAWPRRLPRAGRSE